MEIFATGKIDITNGMDPALPAPKTAESDICVLPAQYYGRLAARRRLWEGERNPMCAALQDAIQHYLKTFGVRTIEERREFAELNHWFKACNQVGPFTFESIGEASDIDPWDLRRSLDTLARHNELNLVRHPRILCHRARYFVDNRSKSIRATLGPARENTLYWGRKRQY